MVFDFNEERLKEARSAGVPDTEIANYVARNMGYESQFAEARKAGVPDSAILSFLVERQKTPSATDYLKSAASGALSGAGMIFQGGGELLARGANAAFGTELRAENPFKGAIEWLEQSKSPGARRAEAETQITGSLFEPSTWDFGKNPSLSGLALQGLNAVGQFAPNLAVALTTAGASVPAQLAVGATVGGLQALGGGAEEERNRIMAMGHDELKSSSKLYNELLGKGVNPDVAKSAVAEAGALGGGIGNAIPSAAEGAFENFLIGALTRGKLRIPSAFGKGVAGRVVTGVAGGAAMGGMEEAIEQVGQNIGSNIAIGGNRPVTSDTLQQFVMGALAEGVVGGGAGALQRATPEEKTAGSVSKIMQAPTADAAIQTALAETSAFESDLAEIPSPTPEIGQAVTRAERVVRETPAYEQLEARKELGYADMDRQAQETQEAIDRLHAEDRARSEQAKAARDAEIGALLNRQMAGAQPEVAGLRRIGESQSAYRARLEALRQAQPAQATQAQPEPARPAAPTPAAAMLEETRDKENQPRLSGEVGIRQEPVQARPEQERGGEAAPTSGSIQAPRPARESNEAQIAFLNERAKAKGFTNADEFLKRDPLGFDQAASEWRQNLGKRSDRLVAESQAPTTSELGDRGVAPAQEIASPDWQRTHKAQSIMRELRSLERGMAEAKNNGDGDKYDRLKDRWDDKNSEWQTLRSQQEGPGPAVLPTAAPEATVSATAEKLKKSEQKAPTVNREPWQMTQMEWNRAREAASASLHALEPSKTGPRGKAQANKEVARMAEVQRLTDDVVAWRKQQLGPSSTGEDIDWATRPVFHRDVVEKAISEGKPVPPAVLADYPDLSKNTQGVAQTATTVVETATPKERTQIPKLGTSLPKEGIRILGQLPPEMTVAQLQAVIADTSPISSFADHKEAAAKELKRRDRKGETIFGRTLDQVSDNELRVAAKTGRATPKTAAQAEIDRRVAVDQELSDRLKQPGMTEAMQGLADEAGWAERGGHLVRNAQGKAAGRTKWISRAEWWNSRPVIENEQFYRDAVAKAISGEKLTRKQKDVVRFLVGMAEDQRVGVDLPAQATPEAVEQAQAELAATARPDTWNTMSEEQKDEELDSIFGQDSRPEARQADRPSARAQEVGPAGAAEEVAPTASGLVRFKIPSVAGPRTVAGRITREMPDGRIEVKGQDGGYYTIRRSELLQQTRPSLSLTEQTPADLRAKEAQAATGQVEEQTAAVRDRNEAILTSPEGTAPPASVAEQKVPTQQQALFSAAQALRNAAETIEKAVTPEEAASPEEIKQRKRERAEQERQKVEEQKRREQADRDEMNRITDEQTEELRKAGIFSRGPEELTPQQQREREIVELRRVMDVSRSQAVVAYEQGKRVRGGKVAESVDVDFSREGPKAQRGSPVATVKSTLSGVSKSLSVPIEIHATAEEAKADTGVDVRKGDIGFYDGKIHLIAESIADPVEAEKGFWHEVLHAGTDRVFKTRQPGTDYDRVLTRFASLNPNVKAEAQKWQARFGQEFADVVRERGIEDVENFVRLRGIEEGIAKVAETKGKIRALNYLIAGLQRLFRSIGLHRLADSMEGWTNAEIGEFIREAQRAAMRETESTQELPAFAKRDVTETEAFRKWFGKSKVVSENGEPLVVYHGTQAEFESFNDAKFGTGNDSGYFARGFYFAREPESASGYSRNGAVYPVYLSIQNPYMWRGTLGDRIKSARTYGAAGLVDVFSGKETHRTNAYGMNVFAVTRLKGRLPSDLHSAVMRRAGLANEDLKGVDILASFYKARRENIPYKDADNELDKVRIEYADKLTRAIREELVTRGHDGIIISNPKIGRTYREYVAFRPEQIKSATGNVGTFDATNPDIRFSRAYSIPAITQSVAAAMRSPVSLGIFSAFNTQYHKAEMLERKGIPQFKAVFNKMQEYWNDISGIAVRSEQKAPSIFRELTGMRPRALKEFFKGAASDKDINAIGPWLNRGTLWGKSPLEGRVWTKEELMSGRLDGNGLPLNLAPLTEFQVDLYKQARAALDQSLEDNAKAIIYRHVKREGVTFDRDMSLQDVAATVLEQLNAQIEELSIERPNDEDTKKAKTEIERLNDVKRTVSGIETRARSLIDHGYMPLMRFGNRTVTAYDGKGKVVFFAAYDGTPLVPGSATAEMNTVADALREEHPEWTVKTGVRDESSWKMYQGLSLDALENFLDFLDPETKAELERDKVIQEYLKNAVNNRSVLKRLIHRKGTPGFSADVARVLASFVTTSARNASAGYNLAEAKQLVQEIPQEMGDVRGEAADLIEYVTKPGEEAAKLRGFLFFNFLGGSVAAAAINATQTLMMTAPYLAQHANAKNVVKAILAAAKTAVADPASLKGQLAEALQKAEREGVTAPQQIYHLTATAANNPFSSNRKFRAFMTFWGGMFGSVEVFNRRIAFASAYQIANENGINGAAAYQFAVKAVNETQGIYSRTNRPNLGRGAAGATILTFKQYSIMYIELLRRLPPQQQLLMLGILVLASGLEGLPFAEDVEDVIDTLGQWLGFATNTGKWTGKQVEKLLGKELARPILKGLGGTLPIDLHSRLGMHNLLPGTAFFKPSEIDKTRDVAEAIGPLGGVLRNFSDSLQLLARGRWDKAAVQSAPKAVKDIYNGMHMMVTGESEDIKGRLALKDVTAGEAAGKLIGFNPRRAAVEGEAKREILLDRNLRQVRIDEIASDWSDGILRQDQEEIRAAHEKMREWNKDHPDMRIDGSQIMRSVRERVKAARMTSEQRFLKSVPKPMRRAAREEMLQ